MSIFDERLRRLKHASQMAVTRRDHPRSDAALAANPTLTLNPPSPLSPLSPWSPVTPFTQPAAPGHPLGRARSGPRRVPARLLSAPPGAVTPTPDDLPQWSPAATPDLFVPGPTPRTTDNHAAEWAAGWAAAPAVNDPYGDYEDALAAGLSPLPPLGALPPEPLPDRAAPREADAHRPAPLRPASFLETMALNAPPPQPDAATGQTPDTLPATEPAPEPSTEPQAGSTGPQVSGPQVTGPQVPGPQVTGPQVNGPAQPHTELPQTTPPSPAPPIAGLPIAALPDPVTPGPDAPGQEAPRPPAPQATGTQAITRTQTAPETGAVTETEASTGTPVTGTPVIETHDAGTRVTGTGTTSEPRADRSEPAAPAPAAPAPSGQRDGSDQPPRPATPAAPEPARTPAPDATAGEPTDEDGPPLVFPDVLPPDVREQQERERRELERLLRSGNNDIPVRLPRRPRPQAAPIVAPKVEEEVKPAPPIPQDVSQNILARLNRFAELEERGEIESSALGAGQLHAWQDHHPERNVSAPGAAEPDLTDRAAPTQARADQPGTRGSVTPRLRARASRSGRNARTPDGGPADPDEEPDTAGHTPGQPAASAPMLGEPVPSEPAPSEPVPSEPVSSPPVASLSVPDTAVPDMPGPAQDEPAGSSPAEAAPVQVHSADTSLAEISRPAPTAPSPAAALDRPMPPAAPVPVATAPGADRSSDAPLPGGTPVTSEVQAPAIQAPVVGIQAAPFPVAGQVPPRPDLRPTPGVQPGPVGRTGMQPEAPSSTAARPAAVRPTADEGLPGEGVPVLPGSGTPRSEGMAPLPAIPPPAIPPPAIPPPAIPPPARPVQRSVLEREAFPALPVPGLPAAQGVVSVPPAAPVGRPSGATRRPDRNGVQPLPSRTDQVPAAETKNGAATGAVPSPAGPADTAPDFPADRTREPVAGTHPPRLLPPQPVPPPADLTRPVLSVPLSPAPLSPAPVAPVPVLPAPGWPEETVDGPQVTPAPLSPEQSRAEPTGREAAAPATERPPVPETPRLPDLPTGHPAGQAGRNAAPSPLDWPEAPAAPQTGPAVQAETAPIATAPIATGPITTAPVVTAPVVPLPIVPGPVIPGPVAAAPVPSDGRPAAVRPGATPGPEAGDVPGRSLRAERAEPASAQSQSAQSQSAQSRSAQVQPVRPGISSAAPAVWEGPARAAPRVLPRPVSAQPAGVGPARTSLNAPPLPVQRSARPDAAQVPVDAGVDAGRSASTVPGRAPTTRPAPAVPAPENPDSPPADALVTMPVAVQPTPVQPSPVQPSSVQSSSVRPQPAPVQVPDLNPGAGSWPAGPGGPVAVLPVAGLPTVSSTGVLPAGPFQSSPVGTGYAVDGPLHLPYARDPDGQRGRTAPVPAEAAVVPVLPDAPFSAADGRSGTAMQVPWVEAVVPGFEGPGVPVSRDQFTAVPAPVTAAAVGGLTDSVTGGLNDGWEGTLRAALPSLFGPGPRIRIPVPEVPGLVGPGPEVSGPVGPGTSQPGVQAVTPQGAPLHRDGLPVALLPGALLPGAPLGGSELDGPQARLLRTLQAAVIRDGHGQPLPPGVQASLAQLMGTSVADVRVIRNAGVPAALRAARAEALTVGRTVFLSPDTPLESAAGRALAAHEVTHALRRDRAGFVPDVLRRVPGRPDSGAEEAVALATEHASAHQSAQDVRAGSRPGMNTSAQWAWTVNPFRNDGPSDGADDSTDVRADASPWWSSDVPSPAGRGPLSGQGAPEPAPPPPLPLPALGMASGGLGSAGSLLGGVVNAAASDRAAPQVPKDTQAGAPPVGRRAQAPAQVDLDQVAREVYARLRDRLSSELRRH
ncbi:eCIS core domain-containing protein [Deinococcus knuensis]|uniref:eCIS core domain-containing protein n=1 Tax=Deinococcus knuensis TaxID=1837380 RepID=A0ABQ2SG32_9DEIO|nr:DUF4157 domain-containing protein [Deinococcus knuensis]GGS22320.1 hypothetical protein GCM10008961_12260 [Deinococcus knuensis]